MDDIAGRKKLLEVSGLKQGRILDIGMGDCACMSFFLAKRGFHVVGIDRSPKAVHDSRANAKKKNFQGTFEAKKANAEHLPFAQNEFDAVIAYNSFHHMDNIRKVIREIFRVCNKGGLVIISDLAENREDTDACELLASVKHQCAAYAKTFRTIRTKHNTIYVCRKQVA